MKISLDERKNLHKLCFSDTDNFVDAHFKFCVSDENSCDYVADQKLVATMYCKTYHVAYINSIFPYHFITSLCVHPDHRNQKYATKLLTNYLQNTPLPFVVLHPFDVDFYKKQGFVPFNYVEKKVSLGVQTDFRAKPLTELEEIEKYINALALDLFLQITEKKFLLKSPMMIMDEINAELADGAMFFALLSNKKCIGYALKCGKAITNYVLIKGSIDDFRVFRGLTYPKESLDENNVFNMARVADVEKLFKLVQYEYKGKTFFSFYLTDNRVAKNSGAYRIFIDNGHFVSLVRGGSTDGLIRITTEDLTYLTLGQPNKAPSYADPIKRYFSTFSLTDFNEY